MKPLPAIAALITFASMLLALGSARAMDYRVVNFDNPSAAGVAVVGFA